MTIEAVLISYLNRFQPEGAEVMSEEGNPLLTFEQPVTTGEVLDRLKVPPEETAIYTFNGQRIEVDETMDTGGVLRIFPSLIGG